MSCLDNCNDNCPDTNPCDYEDCGCLNPTTWDCISKPGVWPSLGITNDMTGYEVLEAISNTIDTLTVGSTSSDDKFVKVASSDTTAGYLINKVSRLGAVKIDAIGIGANEKLRWSLDQSELISDNIGNILELGTDGKLRVILPTITPDLSIVAGAGIEVTGTGPSSDPYVISTNPSIQIVRSCFDGVWRDITLVPSSNASVVVASGTPKYRIRYDGTIEFKGSATYTVTFGAYTSGARKQLLTIGNLPSTCLTALEQNTIADLKSINYIDVPQAGADQYAQTYGYIIRKSNLNIVIEFQSSFINTTTKTIVVNFDGAVSHPNL